MEEEAIRELIKKEIALASYREPFIEVRMEWVKGETGKDARRYIYLKEDGVTVDYVIEQELGGFPVYIPSEEI